MSSSTQSTSRQNAIIIIFSVVAICLLAIGFVGLFFLARTNSQPDGNDEEKSIESRSAPPAIAAPTKALDPENPASYVIQPSQACIRVPVQPQPATAHPVPALPSSLALDVNMAALGKETHIQREVWWQTPALGSHPSRIGGQDIAIRTAEARSRGEWSTGAPPPRAKDLENGHNLEGGLPALAKGPSPVKGIAGDPGRLAPPDVIVSDNGPKTVREDAHHTAPQPLVPSKRPLKGRNLSNPARGIDENTVSASPRRPGLYGLSPRRPLTPIGNAIASAPFRRHTSPLVAYDHDTAAANSNIGSPRSCSESTMKAAPRLESEHSASNVSGTPTFRVSGNPDAIVRVAISETPSICAEARTSNKPRAPKTFEKAPTNPGVHASVSWPQTSQRAGDLSTKDCIKILGEQSAALDRLFHQVLEL